MIIKYLKDKIGSMVCYEYLIDQCFEKTSIRPVGKVNIYFSKKLLEKNYFNYLDSSHIIPSYSQNTDHGDCKCKIKGCQMVWFTN